MNYRKFIFGLFILHICIILELGCKKLEEVNEDKPIEKIQYVNYIINPNGIAFYKKADLQSNKVFVPRGESVELYEESSFQIEETYWTKVRYKGEELFYTNSNISDSDFIQMRNVDFELGYSAKFGIVQKPDTYLYELPFADSKKMEKLELFALLVIQNKGPSQFSKDGDTELWDEPAWLEVKTNSDKIGFVYEGVARYSEEGEAQSVAKSQGILERGFMQISPKSKMERGKESECDIRILKKEEFIPVKHSNLTDGKRNYHFDFYLKTKKELRKLYDYNKLTEKLVDVVGWRWNSEHCTGFIAEDQGVYFSNRQYTKYTFENTKYKGDFKPIEILYMKVSEENQGFDFKDFQFKPISINKNGISYYRASFYEGYQRPEKREGHESKYYIFKKTDGKYELVSNSIEPSSSVDFTDLDKDGIQEMIVTGSYRVTEYKSIYALQDGVYHVIPQMSDHENSFEIKGHRIFYIGRVTDDEGKNGKDVEIEYKYAKGQLVPK